MIMTPKEKINTRAKEYAWVGDLYNPEENFKNGAEYGYQLALERVCGWLMDELTNEVDAVHNTPYIANYVFDNKTDFIESLKQAMKL